MAGRAIYENAARLWAAMENQAVPVGELDGKDAYLAGMCPTGTMGVWLGSLTKLCMAQGLASTSAYHETKSALVQMRCMALLRRGAGQKPSAWALLQRPSRELWEQRIGSLATASSREHARMAQAERVDVSVPIVASEVWHEAIHALREEVRMSTNSQARVAAARTLVVLFPDGSLFDSDPWRELAGEFISEFRQMHATAPAPALEAP